MLKRLAAIALMLCTGEAIAEESSFLLVNGTQYQIRELHLSSHDMDTWGPNVLRPPYVKPGQERQVAFQGYIVDCNVDLKLVFAEIDNQPVWQYLNICNLKKIRLRYDQMSGITTASYDE